MNEVWAAMVVIDRINDGQVMRSMYERAGDEPKRPVRRKVAAAMRWVAEQIAPQPQVPVVGPSVASESVVQV